MKSHLDKMNELAEEMRATKQRLVGLEQDARQPRLAMEADVPADKKTRERTKGAATAVQAMHGDSFSANRVDLDPKRSTSFGDDFTGPPALPCSRDDALVGNGTAAPKSCLPPLEMRSPRRWLTPHRKNLYSDNDHLSPATSLVLPGRRDNFEDFNPI